MADIAPANSGRKHPLEIFHERSVQLADRVRRRELRLLDAVDLAYTAADFAGLVEHYGDDQIQEILAAAFMEARRG